MIQFKLFLALAIFSIIFACIFADEPDYHDPVVTESPINSLGDSSNSKPGGKPVDSTKSTAAHNNTANLFFAGMPILLIVAKKFL